MFQNEDTSANTYLVNPNDLYKACLDRAAEVMKLGS